MPADELAALKTQGHLTLATAAQRIASCRQMTVLARELGQQAIRRRSNFQAHPRFSFRCRRPEGHASVGRPAAHGATRRLYRRLWWPDQHLDIVADHAWRRIVGLHAVDLPPDAGVVLAMGDFASCGRELLLRAQIARGAIRRCRGRQMRLGGDARPAGGALGLYGAGAGIDACITQPESLACRPRSTGSGRDRAGTSPHPGTGWWDRRRGTPKSQVRRSCRPRPTERRSHPWRRGNSRSSFQSG